ncbi:VanZ family protein [Flavobacterium sp.]|uniref:VanZ family protein n=1 Tax=Flavobacterium sp. TaxID=239 RepID=UPI002603A677|nr:VanZ family protein [Flavobacterium sp.]
MPNKKSFWLAFLWTLLILFLSLKTPSGESKFDFPNADKAVHFTFYFVFVVLWFKFLISIKKEHLKYKVGLVFIAILFGVIIELIQHYFTTSRQGDIWDVVANSFGSLMGMIVISSFFKTKATI